MSAPLDVSLAPKSQQEIATQLADITVGTMQTIAGDSSVRVAQLDPNQYDLETARKAMKGGVWYASDFLQLRKTVNGKLDRKDYNLLNGGYANPKYFDQMGTAGIFWMVKPSVSASDALDAAIKGPTLVDCGIACNLARHTAVRDVLGKERYDLVFNNRFNLVYPEPDCSDVFAKIATKADQTSRGVLAGFHNYRHYGKKHPFGDFPSFNVICDGQEKYIGLGTLKEGLTGPQMRQLFVVEFNKPFDPQRGGIVSDKQLTQQWSGNSPQAIQNSIATVKDAQIALKDIPKPEDYHFQTFNVDRIHQIQNTPTHKLTPEVIGGILPELDGFDFDILSVRFAKEKN
jgi:hypothetical protein